MVSNQVKFSGILERPFEPIFIPKRNGSLFYNVPQHFFVDRYKPIGQNLVNRFSTNAPTRIPIKNVASPQIDFARKIPRRGDFCLFNRAHRKIAGQLIEFFMNQPDADTLCSVCTFARDRLNATLFQYAISVALQHRKDTADVAVPSFLHMFPTNFINPTTFPQMREEGRVVSQGNRMSIDIAMRLTASDDEPEQRLAYFREDIGVNLHHWHWHLVYPGEGPLKIVDKDRRGELFYYFHGQMIARYQTERFSNGLNRLVPLSNLREPIKEPYYPKILRGSTNRTLASRYENMVLKDVVRPADMLNIKISELELQLKRIIRSIDEGFALTTSGGRLPLDNPSGINTLGNIIESCTQLSPNADYYGDVHNNGHIMMSFLHDPLGTYLEGFGAIGDFSTAMRDPLFYRWHLYIDQILRRHKHRLSPYSVQELTFLGVTLSSFETRLERKGAPENLLLTFWQRSQVDLGTGLDFGPEGSVYATFSHLQYAPFTYQLQVNNSAKRRRLGTVRIYLAPKYDEKGVQLSFEEQRLSIMELDTFRVTLNPGPNNIVRRSDQSSVTIPYERTFRNVSQATADAQVRFCNCGWPSHMLLPRGSVEGTTYDLFAMISNYDGDNVSVQYDENKDCDDSHSFCGLRDRLYPDARNMGYPFDRKVSSSVRSFVDFVRPFGNMSVTTVQIRFTNTVITRT